jgi:outer membrane protein assembly factor BamB
MKNIAYPTKSKFYTDEVCQESREQTACQRAYGTDMSITQTEIQSYPKPVRLWPGVVLLVLQWLSRYVLPIIAPKTLIFGVLGGVAVGLAIMIWWAFFSRVPHLERWSGLILIIIALFATSRVVDESIANGMMGMMLTIFAIPVLSLALVASAFAISRLASGPRRVVMVFAILLACGLFTLLRTGGLSGEGNSDFHWRWTQSPEERLLAQAGDEPAALEATPVSTVAGTDWPGFRGPNRDGVARGVRITTDWSASPPVELWRRPIGPGWSSFAVRGNLLYTQEQRGNHEVVTCYKATTGQPVWTHRDAARFYESNGGAGPRGTPTLNNGRIYTLGATGILNALNADNGSVVWSRNAAADTKTKLPGWGFSSSPLIVGDLVVVALAGDLAAYDLATGEPRWFGPKGGGGYSSPHQVTINGITQIVLLSGVGVTSVAPSDGKMLWKHPMQSGTPIVQPASTVGGDLLVSDGDGSDLRRIAIEQSGEGWTVKERWSSYGLRPNFNDFVVHKDHAFGFEGGGLACINLENGELKWEGGSYGYGQLVLLPDQDLLVVVSEKGELALAKATPDQFTELGRIPAIKGKTWNHPVLAGDVLLIRNGEEMVAFRLSLESR